MVDTDEVDGDEEEVGFSRNYFLAKELAGSGKKSSRKLADINVVDEQELRDAVSNIVPKHEKEIELLVKSYQKLYKEWVAMLRAGFGLLMYGFGSKKALLEDFASGALTDYSVIVINGYLPSINLDHLLVAMAEVLWGDMKARRLLTKANPAIHFASQSRDDLFDFLNESHKDKNDCIICILIHNIDGPGLRDAESQRFLAKMAGCSLVRVVASIDHVNAPLLWDKKMTHIQFNWCWYQVPTFAPYKVEGIFFPLILANSGSSQIAKTASIVLQSLTSNAQSIYKVLADYQLSHSDEEGLPFNNLYKMCRERFFVTSQTTLTSHLTEFKDHELVKTRKNEDGQDCLYIPLPSDGLKKVLEEIG